MQDSGSENSMAGLLVTSSRPLRKNSWPKAPIAPNLKPDLTDQTPNPKPTLYIQPEKVKLNRVNVHCESQGAFSPGSAASNSPCLLKLTSGICFRNARCGFGVVGSCPRAKTWCSEHTSSDITSYTFQD